MICLKVRLADVINCSGEDWKQGFGGRISQKHLDFVIADAASTAILLAIELDDQSHKRADRVARDDFLDRAMTAANVPLLASPRRQVTMPVRWDRSSRARSMAERPRRCPDWAKNPTHERDFSRNS